MNRFTKAGAVIFGAVILTTLAIEASDLAQGLNGSLTGSISESTGPCRVGETLFTLKGRTLCVDTFEASASSECPLSVPNTELDTRQNFTAGGCRAVSLEGNVPWRFVSKTEAQQLCARANKRLLTNEEWYAVVSGSTELDNQCNVDSGAVSAAGQTACKSPAGIYDLVGNVWEWVDAEVVDGRYEDRELPRTGFVSAVDQHGVITETTDVPIETFAADYAFTNPDGVRGMIRGGFYDSQTDAGIFALNDSVPTEFRDVN